MPKVKFNRAGVLGNLWFAQFDEQEVSDEQFAILNAKGWIFGANSSEKQPETNNPHSDVQPHRHISPEQFGAVGDGVADDSAAFLAAIAAAKANKQKLVAHGKYAIEQNLNFREVAVDCSDARFNLRGDAVIYIGGHGNSSQNPDQSFGFVLRGAIKLDPTHYPNPSVICMGSKNQTIKIKYVDYIQFYQSTDPATYPRDASQAYSTFDINFAVRISIDTDPRFDNAETLSGAGSRGQWFNENTFRLKRCLGLDMRGSYRHNCNLFDGGSFESASSYINIEVGNKNKFTNTRLEGIGRIHFGAQTEGNILERSYFGSLASLALVDIVDLGVINRLETELLGKFVRTRLFELSPFSRKFNGFADEYRFLNISRRIQTSVNYGTIARLEKFKMVGKSDLLILHFDGQNARYGAVITVFDAAGNRLNANDIAYNSNFLRPTSREEFEGSAATPTRWDAHRFMIDQAGEYFVEVRLVASRDKADGLAHNLTLDLYAKFPIAQPKLQKPLPLNAPTQYLGFQGDVIEHRNGKTVVSLHLQSTVAAKDGLTVSLPDGVLSKTPLQRGDVIGIESPSTGNVHWGSVASVAGHTLTLNEALPDWVAVGDFAYISRLIPI